MIDVPRILFQICVRLDNDTLHNLSRTVLWFIIRTFANTNDFWHLRTEFSMECNLSPRLQEDWKRIYYTRSAEILKSMLYRSIELDQYQLVSYVLSHVRLSSREKYRVVSAAISQGSTMLQTVLLEPDIDLQFGINLLALARKTCIELDNRSTFKRVLSTRCLRVHIDTHTSEETANILIADDRIQPELFTINILRVFVRALYHSIEDRVSGFIIGGLLANKPTTREMLGETIEGDSTYSLLARYILLKRPSSADLAAWMARWKNMYLREAARGLISEDILIDPRTIAFRELLRSMTNPSMSLQEIIDGMNNRGETRESISMAARLVGLHVGALTIGLG